MYEFLDDNPYIEAHPVSYVNFPPNIARNNDMISVNSTIEIDLTGQCCSESMGTAQFSGTGGQHDYARGAFDAPGGKSIIAFYSTARGGEVSRVVAHAQIRRGGHDAPHRGALGRFRVWSGQPQRHVQSSASASPDWPRAP